MLSGINPRPSRRLGGGEREDPGAYGVARPPVEQPEAHHRSEEHFPRTEAKHIASFQTLLTQERLIGISQCSPHC